jgi:hypothetical protein
VQDNAVGRLNHTASHSLVNWNVAEAFNPSTTAFNSSRAAGLGARHGLSILHTLPASVHRTVMNAFKGNPAVLGQRLEFNLLKPSGNFTYHQV